jgi:hypothetical protein
MSTISTRICDKCSQGFILTNRESSLPISITLDEANVLDFHVACLASMTLLEWFEVVGGLTQAEVNLIKSWQLTHERHCPNTSAPCKLDPDQQCSCGDIGS